MGPTRLTRGRAGRDLARLGRASRTCCFARTARSAGGRADLGRLAACGRPGRRPDMGIAGLPPGGRPGSLLGSAGRPSSSVGRTGPARRFLGSTRRTCSGLGWSAGRRRRGARRAVVESAPSSSIVGPAGSRGACTPSAVGRDDRLGSSRTTCGESGGGSASNCRPVVASSGRRRAPTAAPIGAACARLERARARLGSAQDRRTRCSRGSPMERAGRAPRGPETARGGSPALERTRSGLVGSRRSRRPFHRRRPRRGRRGSPCPRAAGAA